ncbi:MAG: hypothetical protein Q8R13_01840 [bacterium]|nr:hypothetical protein [bacterium]
MLTVLSYIGLAVSLGGMAYLVIRALPRMRQLPEQAPIPRAKWEHIVIAVRDNMYWRKWQPRVMAFLARFLHRSRLGTLKMDNRLSRWIESVRKRSRLMSARSHSWFLERQLARKKAPVISFAVLAEEKLKAKEDELLKRIQENPKDPAAYREIGEIYERMGNQSDASEAVAAAVKLEAVLAASSAKGMTPDAEEAPSTATLAISGEPEGADTTIGHSGFTAATGTRSLVRRKRRKTESA